MPKSQGAWLIGFLSITSTVGRVFFGKISDLKFVNRLYMYQFSVFAIGLTTLLCPLTTNYAGLVSYALIFGFFDGCFVGQVAVITADVVGHEKLSQAVGNMFGTLAIPMSLGPPLAGESNPVRGFCRDLKELCLSHFPTKLPAVLARLQEAMVRFSKKEISIDENRGF